jgi:hypothetical protein
MRIVSKALVYFLLGWALLAPLSGQTPAHAPKVAPASGCHHEQPQAPQPASYVCCLTGHNVAILQSPHVESLTILNAFSPVELSLSAIAISPELLGSVAPSGDPPSNFVLRI